LKRHEHGQDLKEAAGRPTLLSKESLADLHELMYTRDNQVDSLKTSEFERTVIDMVKKEQLAKGMGMYDKDLGKVSTSWMEKLKQQFDAYDNAEKRTKNRTDATFNVRNFLSLVVILYCVYFPDFQDGWRSDQDFMPYIPACSVWNLDSTQIVLSDDNLTFEKIYTMRGARKRNKKMKKAIIIRQQLNCCLINWL
jgi:hypothetical protein